MGWITLPQRPPEPDARQGNHPQKEDRACHTAGPGIPFELAVGAVFVAMTLPPRDRVLWPVRADPVNSRGVSDKSRLACQGDVHQADGCPWQPCGQNGSKGRRLQLSHRQEIPPGLPGLPKAPSSSIGGLSR